MSEPKQQEPITSQDPLNYAPPWLREKQEQRLPQSVAEPRIELRRSEGAVRAPERSVSPALERQLETAVYESLRHSLEPQVMPAPPSFGRGPRQRSMAGFAGRLVVAVGVSAVVAMLFVIMAPTSPEANSGTSLAATIQQFSNAVARTAEDVARPVTAEFKAGAVTADATPQTAAARPSELQQFLQWRDKAGSGEQQK